jgi:peptidoglycan glycosyltransferase
MRLFRKTQTDDVGAYQHRTWREYQQYLQQSPRPVRRRGWIVAGLVSAAVFGAAFLFQGFFSSSADHRQAQPPQAAAPPSKEALITKKDVGILLQHFSEQDLMAKQIDLPFKDQQIHIETSLDEDLQNRLTQAMDRKNSRFIGIVVMAADTGRVQALAGFNKVHPDDNPCLINTFPAASLFKIVTAAAAVDKCDYNAETRIRFNGYKHTLYKNQLKEQNNQYTNTLSFKDSFAQSVNPVFGKLGALYLDQAVLEKYAAAFGFNQPINFELPVAPSHIDVKAGAYQRAEIASGFNNDTTISPLHAAMMASAVINNGRMVIPTMVDRITDAHGRLLYQAQTSWQGRAMSAKASGILVRLMETTVQSGTGRKAFRGCGRSRVLSKLDIGGKTGSIYNRAHDARFDWFVGFADEKKGPGRLVVAALVAHEEFIGIRAAEYAKMAMTYYFQGLFAQRETASGSSGG